MLMNLTRWRNIPWDWSTTVTEVHKSFRHEMYLGDQDIFNIIFSEVNVMVLIALVLIKCHKSYLMSVLISIYIMKGEKIFIL